jgi:hypothetical protein
LRWRLLALEKDVIATLNLTSQFLSNILENSSLWPSHLDRLLQSLQLYQSLLQLLQLTQLLQLLQLLQRPKQPQPMLQLQQTQILPRRVLWSNKIVSNFYWPILEVASHTPKIQAFQSKTNL